MLVFYLKLLSAKYYTRHWCAVLSKEFGFVYHPGNEIEVCILFGMLMPYIHKEMERIGFSYNRLYLEEYPDTFPDCNLLIDDKIIQAEFELFSSNFLTHKHDATKCNLIICWENDWYNSPLPVLELSKVMSNGEIPNTLLLNTKSKYPNRGIKRWQLEEFKSRIKNIELAKYVDEITSSKKLLFQLGRGKRFSTLGISSDGREFPLWIEDNGKAGICYYGVNSDEMPPLLSENKIKHIRDLLDESNHKPQPRKWHYISALDSSELISKLRQVIAIMTN